MWWDNAGPVRKQNLHPNPNLQEGKTLTRTCVPITLPPYANPPELSLPRAVNCRHYPVLRPNHHQRPLLVGVLLGTCQSGFLRALRRRVGDLRRSRSIVISGCSLLWHLSLGCCCTVQSYTALSYGPSFFLVTFDVATLGHHPGT